MKTSKTALYYQETGEPKRYAVLKENTDGTVDLGLSEDGPLVVGSCPVAVKTAKPGYCILLSKSEDNAEVKADAAEAKKIADEVQAAEKKLAVDQKADAAEAKKSQDAHDKQAAAEKKSADEENKKVADQKKAADAEAKKSQEAADKRRR